MHLAPMLLLWQLPEGQCQGCGLSGENTQLATPRNITTVTQSQAQPGKNSCCNGTSGSGAGLCSESARHRTASADREKQMHNAELLAPTLLLLHGPSRAYKIDGSSLVSACSHVLMHSCLWLYFPTPRPRGGAELRRPRWSLRMAAESVARVRQLVLQASFSTF